MDLKAALKDQYHRGLAMLTQCVERCPEMLWDAPNPPTPLPAPEGDLSWCGIARPFWRIAFHDAYFTHLYLGQGESAFQPPPAETSGMRRTEFEGMWRAPWDLEPYELLEGTTACRPSEILEYIAFIDGLVDATVDGLDLDAPTSGFSWYPKETKLSHELMNLRHLQGHVGQLSELLMLRGIDIDWI